MIRYLAAGVKHAFGLHRPGRRLPVRPDDILLASYPESGGTSMRFLIANLLHPDRAVSFGNLHKFVLDPEFSVKRDFDRAPRPRIIAAHGSFDARYRRVIYIVRDPRDVALSQYERLRRLSRDEAQISLEDFITRFLATGNGASRISPEDSPASWGENAGSWLAARSQHSGFLLVRYEDLVADTARELTRVAGFAGLPVTSAGISQAIERSNGAASAKSNWQSGLPEPQVAQIEVAWGDIMACLGYELVTRDSRGALQSSLLALLMGDAERNLGIGTGATRPAPLVAETSASAVSSPNAPQ